MIKKIFAAFLVAMLFFSCTENGELLDDTDPTSQYNELGGVSLQIISDTITPQNMSEAVAYVYATDIDTIQQQLTIDYQRQTISGTILGVPAGDKRTLTILICKDDNVVARGDKDSITIKPFEYTEVSIMITGSSDNTVNGSITVNGYITNFNPNPTITPTWTPYVSNTPTIHPTTTPTWTPVATNIATITPTWTPYVSNTPTIHPTVTPTWTPVVSNTATVTPTWTPVVSNTATVTPTWTPFVTNTPPVTPTWTPFVTNTPTVTPTITPTWTPVVSNTPTMYPTDTPTATVTTHPTATPTPSALPLGINLLNNPSFDEPAFSGWTAAANVAVTNIASMATNALVVREASAYIDQTVATESNAIYELNVLVNQLYANTGKIVIDTDDIYDEQCQFVIEGTNFIQSNYSSQFLSLSNNVTIRIFSSADYEGHVHLDNFSLVKISNP